MVDGVALAKKHQRSTGRRAKGSAQQLQQGGIIDAEMFVDISNVQVVPGVRQGHAPGAPDRRRPEGPVLPEVRDGAVMSAENGYAPRSGRAIGTRSRPQGRARTGQRDAGPRPGEGRDQHGRRGRPGDGRLDAALEDLAIITGQKAVVTKARKSIAGFKLREGMAIGAKVTLRGARMWEFVDRLVAVASRGSATSAV